MSRRQFYFLIFSTISLFSKGKCDLKTDVRNKAVQLQERSKLLYGEAQKRPIKKWELELDDTLFYPNGDKQKLAEIAHLWSNYYQCTSRMVDGVTSSGHLPNANVVAYQGATARLICGLCVAPGEEGYFTWFYTKSIHNLNFTRLAEQSTIVSNINLRIYNVQMKDAGVYYCQLGESRSGLVVLEVIDDEMYDVVLTNVQSPHITNSISLGTPQNVITFTQWSTWSECSRCNSIGKRRRFGICYVRLDTSEATTTKSHVPPNLTKLFRGFPDGIYCRSHLLPTAYLNNPNIKSRNNLIMIEECKVPCNQIFEIRSKTGELIERANNTAGLYSLNQKPLLQPPPPERDVIFVESGQPFILKCPGTTLCDIPITWRVGTKTIEEVAMEDDTGGRIRVNARDFIVFASIEYSDSNVYSCFQSLNLAGVVKLEVWRDARFANGRPIAIIALIAIALVLRVALRLLRSKLLRHV